METFCRKCTKLYRKESQNEKDKQIKRLKWCDHILCSHNSAVASGSHKSGGSRYRTGTDGNVCKICQEIMIEVSFKKTETQTPDVTYGRACACVIGIKFNNIPLSNRYPRKAGGYTDKTLWKYKPRKQWN